MKMKNEMKNYHIELHAIEIKPTAKHYARDKVCAHFSTNAEPATVEFVKVMMDAIDFYWNQQKRSWTGYAIGKLFVEAHREELTVMSPAYFEGHRSQPVFEEIKSS